MIPLLLIKYFDSMLPTLFYKKVNKLTKYDSVACDSVFICPTFH